MVPLSDLMTVVPYRCVCGNTVGLINNEARSCLLCDRPIPATAFQNGDATIIGGSEPAEIEPEEFDPLIRQRLRHFRVLSPLGQGGMGSVYHAVDESLERDVALKVIRSSKNNVSESRLVQRLLQEARAQARVAHPNIVQVYYVDAQAEIPFLAMELISGPTLEERLKAGPIGFSEIVDIAIQTSRALRAAAQYQIVHGDIKPANLLLGRDGIVKLSDFGLARPVDLLLTDPVGISGTPNYLSPEACCGEATDHRSDMYALGVVLFQMTFDRLPYAIGGASLMTRLEAHVDWPVEFPAVWPSHLPKEWKLVLARLLAKDPEVRYRDYDELLAELETLKPIELPYAGRAVRSLAWLIDLGLLFLVMQGLRSAFRGGDDVLQHAILATLSSQLSAVALIAAAFLHALTGQTPGTKLMQIRIVDDHGLRLGKSSLFVRALAQQMPLWGLVGLRSFAALGLIPLGWTVALVLGAFSLIDAAFAVFRPDRRSFHDLIFHTHVVLDTTTARRTSTVKKSGRPGRPQHANTRPVAEDVSENGSTEQTLSLTT
ncbi:protein kinase domain-containing protein [Planctomicrobium piriforme]|uniref:Serine/threonine protein kinase n=1 Tax=Planctomicrobium piriforme TaxID=1576369 RepID=A0A1I3B732_9PLAN|nr:protein kinase [Planctomicrobium piriforme]SFH57779.1 Serine/threonine protein kinase [Planctomicrobium piriforme]